jgi:hypothetical protein
MYRRRVRTFLEYTAVPFVFITVFMTVCLLFSLRNLMYSQFLLPLIAVICAVILGFALAARLMLATAEHKVRVHSRYTYIEIALKDVIISVYAGSLAGTVLRRIVVIPLASLKSVQIAKNGKVQVVADSAEIRDYTGNSDRLGYIFKENNLQFEEFFYRESGFTRSDSLFIPNRFMNNEEIVESILAAKERFDNLEPEKPYIFEELEFVKTRRMRELAKRIRNN